MIIQWEGAGAGGPDQDNVNGDAGDRLFGDRGNDRIKVHSGSVLLVDGGEDTDKLCGLTDQEIDVEQHICDW